MATIHDSYRSILPVDYSDGEQFPYVVATTRNSLYPTARCTALGFDSAEDVALFLIRRDLARYTVYRDGVEVSGLGGTVREMVKTLERKEAK